MIIDIFGHEYGYTPDQVLNLPVIGALMLINRIHERYPTKKGKFKKLQVASTKWLEDLQKG